MPDWYVSSAAYAAIPVFQTSHAYNVGDFVVPTAPALQAKWAFRCTTAGTSSTEPTWNTGNNNNTISGTATFTNVTGQSAYFWAAAAGDVPTVFSGRATLGDRIFISSDHSETQTGGLNLGVNASDFSFIQFLCVNRAGSTPPGAADLATGATITVDTNNLSLRSSNEAYYYGITFIETTSGNIIFGNLQAVYTVYCKNCAFYLNNTNASSRIVGGAGQSCGAVILDNCTMQFGNSAQKIDPAYAFAGGLDLTWINTQSNAVTGWITASTVTWDPANKHAGITLSGGNLAATSSAGSGTVNQAVIATQAISPTIKQYFEVTISGTTGQYFSVGVMNGGASLSSNLGASNGAAFVNTLSFPNSRLYENGGTQSQNLPALASGQVIRVAIDRRANRMWWAINNNAWTSGATPWMGDGGLINDPATGVGGLDISAVTGTIYPAISSAWTGDVATINIGPTFAYAMPSGFSVIIASGSIPTVLLGASSYNSATFFQARGVDLSAVTGILVTNSGNSGSKYLFESCKIASSAARYDTTGVSNTKDFVELVNCFDGNNIISEAYQPVGAVTTEFNIARQVAVLGGGATNSLGAFSHKMVSNTNVDKFVNPLQGFWMDFECTTGSKTATVDIISSGTLMNDEIALYVHYQGTSGSPVASFASSFIPTPLTTPTPVASSTAVWNSMPATPIKQKLQVTFIQQTPGRVRAQVRLGKANTTCYYNPQVVIT